MEYNNVKSTDFDKLGQECVISPWWSLQKVSSLEYAHTPLLLFVSKDNVLKCCPRVSDVAGEKTSFCLDYFAKVYST